MATAGVAQLAEGFRFDLANALAGAGKVLPHFFERVFASILQPETHFDNLLFARAKRLQYFGGLLAQIEVDDSFRWGDHSTVDQEVAEV